MQAALGDLTTRQAHIQTLGLELLLQFGIGQGLAALLQGVFNGLLGLIDGCTTAFFLLYGQTGQAFHPGGDGAGFSQKLGFGVFQINRCSGGGKALLCLLNQFIQLVHGRDSHKTQKLKEKGPVLFQAPALYGETSKVKDLKS